jgi:hypothetical protein
MFKIKPQSNGYFDTVNIPNVLPGNLIYSFQLISFGVMQALTVTIGIYYISDFAHS